MKKLTCLGKGGGGAVARKGLTCLGKGGRGAACMTKTMSKGRGRKGWTLAGRGKGGEGEEMYSHVPPPLQLWRSHVHTHTFAALA